MADVSLEHLTKIYPGGVAALVDLSLRVADGEFMVLVGPSGCGKTTCLRLIAGLEEATEGTVRIGGEIVNDLAPKDRDVAMVFQDHTLYPHMSVYRNLAFSLKLRGCRRREIKERVMATARLLGIEDLLDRKPDSLSGGQRQRVALGRAIVRQPRVFLFDEPLSNLDAKLRLEMRAELSRLHRQLGTTVIYVTHDQTEAMTLGQRIAVLDEGRLQQIADPLTLYRRPANRFVAGFIGSPPMNFFPGILQRRGGLLEFVPEGERGWSVSLPTGTTTQGEHSRAVLLGIRPEDILLPAESAPGNLPTISSTVNLVEQLGEAQIVYLEDGEARFAARAAPHLRLVPGQRVRAALQPEAIHLFDRTTGKRLGPAN